MRTASEPRQLQPLTNGRHFHQHSEGEPIEMSYRFALPEQLRSAVDKAADDWQLNDKVDRL